MFNSLGDILADGATGSGRHCEPVHRHSHRAGRCEATFWRGTDRATARRVVLAARKYDLTGRKVGRRNGPLGHVALEILDLMANLMDRRSGRLDPSLDWLAGKLRRSRDAVTRALRALRAHGFLDWLRRYVETGNTGPGPRVQQTSNAYRIHLPARAARLLPPSVPVPDDHAQLHADRTAERAAQEAALPFIERARLQVDEDDTPLGAALLRLAAGMAGRA